MPSSQKCIFCNGRLWFLCDEYYWVRLCPECKEIMRQNYLNRNFIILNCLNDILKYITKKKFI